MNRFPPFLLDGYRSFLSGRYASENQRYRRLAEHGQQPTAMVIACCDSRAAPETVFDCGPGELFVLRNVANLVPPFEPDGGRHGTSAAIEFAVLSIGVSHIVVMGHGRCGGIEAALETEARRPPAGDFIGKWMSLVEPVAAPIRADQSRSPAERQATLERVAISHSIANLRRFPYVGSREAEGRLALHGAWFDIATGELWIMDADTGEFSRPDA
ncbi:MAG TPA: carbonic anhydrase [Devosiaceae bacterium]|nr:carbonic anhydrase [Devosiaceae bacterium]